MHAICHRELPFRPWAEPDLARLPGMRPVADWLVTDEVFAAQMALRDRILARTRDAVIAEPDPEIGREALALVLEHLPAGYARADGRVLRPDGVSVDIAGDTPMAVIARLVQEDVCLLVRGAEYRLAGAALLFPASWTLSEKLGRPLTAIHAPVPDYAGGLAARVARLFEALPPGRVLMRANRLLYHLPDLHQPRREGAGRAAGPPRYLRMERQCLRRLPLSGAVAFTIHTYVLPLEALSPADRAALET